MENTFSKKYLRNYSKEIIASFNDDQLQVFSKNLTENLVKLLGFLIDKSKSFTLGFFKPLKDEVQVSLQELINNFSKLKVSYPGLDEDSMNYFYAKDGDFGFNIPLDLREKKLEPEVLLAPSLGFTKSGFRLGRGGGYFDRYLKNFTGVSIGLCFESLIYEDFEIEKHDKAFNYVVTNKKIYNCLEFRK